MEYTDNPPEWGVSSSGTNSVHGPLRDGDMDGAVESNCHQDGFRFQCQAFYTLQVLQPRRKAAQVSHVLSQTCPTDAHIFFENVG